MLHAIFAVLSFLSAMPAQATETVLPLATGDGHQLSGVLTMPEGQPTAVALLLPGSGNVGIDGDVSSPFVGQGYRGADADLSVQMAAALASAGIASYRYAKRGFEDASELPHQTFEYLLSDAQDALALLAGRVPGVPMVVVGFSEGALLATHLAALTPVDGLFLLGTPSRAIDEILDYQFVEWPVQVLSTHLDANHDGLLEGAELASDPNLPLVGAPVDAADADGDGTVSVSAELIPFYRAFYLQMRGLLATPTLAGWHAAMVSLPPFSSVAARVSAPVFAYHGALDPQVNPFWVVTDSRYFPGLRSVRIFPGVGHAFAPLDGAMGELKTSGPFSEEIMQAVAADIQAL